MHVDGSGFTGLGRGSIRGRCLDRWTVPHFIAFIYPPLVAAKVLLGAVVYSWVVRGVFDLLFRVSVIMGSKVEGYPPPHMVSEFMLIKDTGLVVYS